MDSPIRSRRRRSTISQFDKLLNYLKHHPYMVKGSLINKGFSKKHRRSQWKEITSILNEMDGGSKKSCNEWQKAWNDKKGNLLRKLKACKSQSKKIQSHVYETLSPIEKKMIQLLGWESQLNVECLRDKKCSFSSSEDDSVPNADPSPETNSALEESDSGVSSSQTVSSSPVIISVSNATVPTKEVSEVLSGNKSARNSPTPAEPSLNNELSTSAQGLSPCTSIVSDQPNVLLSSLPNFLILQNHTSGSEVLVQKGVSVPKRVSLPDVISSHNILVLPELSSLTSQHPIIKTENVDEEEAANSGTTVSPEATSSPIDKEPCSPNNTDLLRELIEVQNKALLMIAESSKKQAKEASKQTAILRELVNQIKGSLKKSS